MTKTEILMSINEHGQICVQCGGTELGEGAMCAKCGADDWLEVDDFLGNDPIQADYVEGRLNEFLYKWGEKKL